MSAVHINDHILDLVVIRKYSFSKILKLDISKSLIFWAFSLLSPPTTIAWLYSSPLFLCISLSYLLPGLKSFPKQLSIGNFVANNLNTFILFFAAPAMQLSNPGYIHLFKFTFQFLTTAGAKSQNCTYRYHNRFIISTLFSESNHLLRASSSQQQFQIFNSPRQTSILPLPHLFDLRQKTSFPASQGNILLESLNSFHL